MKHNEIKEIINKYSIPLGFGYWIVKITKDKECVEVGKAYAKIGTNMYMKVLDVYFSPIFYQLDNITQKNIVIHELIHARVELQHMKIEQMAMQEEELMVNDIVNCVEEAMRK